MINFKEEFKLDEDEIEKLCETAEEFCKCDPPLNDDDEPNDDAVLESWINLEMFE